MIHDTLHDGLGVTNAPMIFHDAHSKLLAVDSLIFVDDRREDALKIITDLSWRKTYQIHPTRVAC